MRVHFGCGLRAPQSWVNCDSSPRVWIDKIPGLSFFGYKKRFKPWVRRINVTRRLPFRDSSVTHVYSSHMIEHLDSNDAKFFLKECYRIMTPNGRIRLMTPNLFLLVNDYLGRRNSPELRNHAADFFMKWLGMTPAKSNSLFDFISNPWTSKNLHRWIYDEYSLSSLLSDIGFSNVESHINWRTDFPDLESLECPAMRESSTCAEGFR